MPVRCANCILSSYLIAQITPSNRPVRIFKSFLSFSAGASYITFHPEATNHVDRSLSLIRNAGLKSGLVFNPSTSLDYLKYVMDKVDIVLLMSVNPGFGGQKFIPSVLAKAREARKLIDESVNPPSPSPLPRPLTPRRRPTHPATPCPIARSFSRQPSDPLPR